MCATNSGYGSQPNATSEVSAFVNKWRQKKILPTLAKPQDLKTVAAIT